MTTFILILFILSINAVWIMCLVNMTDLRGKVTKIILLVFTIILAISIILVGIITAKELKEISPKVYANNEPIYISYNQTLTNTDFVTFEIPVTNDYQSQSFASIISANWNDGSCDGIQIENNRLTLTERKRTGEDLKVLINTKKGNLVFNVLVN